MALHLILSKASIHVPSLEPAWQQGSNVENDKLIKVHRAELSSKEVHKSDGLVQLILELFLGFLGPTKLDQPIVCT